MNDFSSHLVSEYKKAPVDPKPPIQWKENKRVTVFSRIEEERVLWIKEGGGEPELLVLGNDRYAELCGYIAAMERCEKPLELMEFRGMKIIISIYRDSVCCGKFTSSQ